MATTALAPAQTAELEEGEATATALVTTPVATETVAVLEYRLAQVRQMPVEQLYGHVLQLRANERVGTGSPNLRRALRTVAVERLEEMEAAETWWAAERERVIKEDRKRRKVEEEEEEAEGGQGGGDCPDGSRHHEEGEGAEGGGGWVGRVCVCVACAWHYTAFTVV